ncbi:hypothetical protein LTR15_004560 [Elasticomyces elasticus]|nr:hypothetical protein LTR15_004560 [Elasticomyces elasticus]
MDSFDELKSLAFREQEQKPDIADLVKTAKVAIRQASANEGVVYDPNQEYLLKLGGPFDSPETVRSIANLSTVPKVYDASSTTDAADDGDKEEETSRFIRVTATTRQALLSWVTTHQPGYEPLFIAHCVARKALAANSMAPMLGVDTTMPQHRLNGAEEALPRQDQYPVYYFFYGTLADTEVLRRHLGDDVPAGYYTLLPASIAGGRVKMWGQYRALVDSNQNSVVHGSAFLVQSAEHEERLRSYETSMYEVVRCRITIAATTSEEERVVLGCTFRFVSFGA